MICTNCHAEINDKKCPYCGYELTDGEIQRQNEVANFTKEFCECEEHKNLIDRLAK